jgi:group I intron endonuclease
MNTKFKYPKSAGIYKLTCVVNGKVYIGKTIDLRMRLSYHKRCGSILKLKSILKSAIMKYGWDSFNVEILEVVENFDKIKDNENLLKRESYYIELFDSVNKDKGYNICSYSNDSTGLTRNPLTEEHKKKISDSLMGKPNLAIRGVPRSEEIREKIRVGNLGKVISEEHKEKLRMHHTGIPRSEETKEKLRQINIGKKMSDAMREKMRKLNTGRKMSEETKEKLRQANLGNKNAKKK